MSGIGASTISARLVARNTLTMGVKEHPGGACTNALPVELGMLALVTIGRTGARTATRTLLVAVSVLCRQVSRVGRVRADVGAHLPHFETGGSNCSFFFSQLLR